MFKPKVTIIVPIYNVEKYFDRCMQSLLNQTLKEIEIILVDDESPDNCPAMCDEYAKLDRRIKVVHKKNQGLGFARNSGLEIATGEYIAFVDSDDYVDLKMYETLYNQAKDLELDTVYCGFNKVTNNFKIHPISEVTSLTIFDNKNDIEGVLLDMIGSEPTYPFDRKLGVSVWRALYSKKNIDAFAINFCSEREFISEDVIFHIDYLQKANKIAFIPDPMYFYCDNPNSSSLTKIYREDRFEKFVVLYNEICSRFPHAETKNRANRILIGYARYLIFLLSDYNITLNKKNKIIRSICNSFSWQDLCVTYDYKKLPFHQYVMLYFIRRKMYYSLISASYLKNKIKSLVFWLKCRT